MYEEFFGLDRRPFASHPDATCIHWTIGHQSAFATLQAGIDRLSPITLVTGEVGCGKTTLIRHFLETAPVDLTIGLVSNFVSGNGSVLEWTLMAFDQSFEDGTEPELLNRFQEFTIGEFAAGRRTALIVDEAQNVSADDLECLRLLSNVNADGDVLLLMFLVGQPELRQRLADPKYRQIGQRIGSDFHLNAMTEEETADYVRYLLEQAGAKYDVFDEQALSVIFASTSGTPRKINLLADLCMVTAFAEEIRVVDAGLVERILADLRARGIFASLTMPTPEVGAPPISAPVTHAAWVPKLVGLDGAAKSSDRAFPKAVTESARAPAVVSLEPAADLDTDDHDDKLVSPLNDASLPSLAQPDGISTEQVSSGSGEDLEAKTASDTQLRASVLSRRAVGTGWVRYAGAAAALLVVGLGAANVGMLSDSANRSGDRDQAPSEFAHSSTPMQLQAVRTLEDGNGPIVLPELLQSVIPSRHAQIGDLRRSQAQAGAIAAKPHVASLTEAARLSQAAQPRIATFQSDIAQASLDANSPAHRYASLAKTVARNLPDGLETAARSGRWTSEFKPQPPSGPIVTASVAPPVEPAVVRTSPNSRSSQKLQSLAVVHDLGLRELRPALRVPFEPLEAPSSAGGIVWQAAAVLTMADAGVLNQSILAGFQPDRPLGNQKQIAQRQIAMLDAPDSQLGRAKRSVRIVPLKNALMLLNGGDPGERPRVQQVLADQVTLNGVSNESAAASSGDDYFKLALALSPDDPTGAAVLYTRAALRGHKRSAYYLGQIYETGDGVPVDTSLARAWYSAVGPDNSRAQRRIRALPEPGGNRTLPGAPIPLWVETTPGGKSEFVWTSGQGGDVDMFFVQVARTENGVPEATYKAALSGAFLDVPSSAGFWRILAVDPASAQYASSEWFRIPQPGEARTLARKTPASANADPSAIIAHAPGGASVRVEKLNKAFASKQIPTRVIASKDVVGAGNQIYFFYGQDRDTADAVAKLVSEDDESSVLSAAPGNDDRMALPGEILVILDDSRR